MLAEQQCRSLGDDVQYLTDRQLEELVEQTPGNDIKDYEDLQSGGPRGWAPAWERLGGWAEGQGHPGMCEKQNHLHLTVLA